MRGVARGLVFVAVGVTVLLVGCGNRVELLDDQAARGQGSSTVRTGVIQVPVAGRKPAPDLKGPGLGGGRLSLADYRGEVVVLNVWGSWCPPCREEAPHLRRVWQETRGEGVQFLGIDTRDTEAAARAFEREFGIGYPSFFDPDGRLPLRFRGVTPSRPSRAP